MTVLQIGVERSGNSWLYRLIQAMFDVRGVEQERFIVGRPMHREARDWELSFEGQDRIDTIDIRPDGVYYGIAGVRWKPVADLDAYVDACTHVWTHSAWCEWTPEVLSRVDRAVYIVRDPRDVALSKAAFAFSDYALRHLDPDPGGSPEEVLANRFYGNLIRWVKHVGDHLQARERWDVHFVTFEGLLHDFPREARSLAEHLGLELSEDELEEVRDRVSFSRLKKKGPEHLRKGRSYRWKERLDDRQKSVARRLAGGMLRILNYPIRDTEERLPEVPASIDATEIGRAMARRRGAWSDKVRMAWTLLTSSRSWREKLRKGFAFLTGRA